MKLRSIIGVGLFLLFSGSYALAQGGINVPGKMAPSPKSKTVEVLRGEATRIVLEAASSSRRTLVYKIRTPPAKGSITDPKEHPTIKTAAVVTYTPPTDLGVVIETFTFAVKEPDGIFSPNATIAIKIVDPRPKLEVPKDVQFGRIPLGESSLQTITIRNTGTADYAGAMKLPEPWQLVRENRFVTVPAGGQTRVLVSFVPDEARRYFEELKLSEGKGSVVIELSGTAFAPVSIEPKRIELKWDGETRRRVASVVARNQMTTELELTVATDERLWADAKVKIPAQGKLTIEFHIPASDQMKYEGVARLKAVKHDQEIQVTAEKVPAVIALKEELGEEGITYSLKTGDKAVEKKLVVRNLGGAPAFVFGEIEKPFTLKEGTASRKLDSGGELEFTIGLDASSAGEFKRSLKILGGPNNLQIPLHAVVFEGKTVKQFREPEGASVDGDGKKLADYTQKNDGGVVTEKTLREAIAERQQALRQRAGSTVRDEIFDASIPSVPVIFQKKTTPETITLWWPHPVKGKQFYYVLETEIRRVDPATGVPFPDWYRFSSENVKMETDAKGVTAVITGLQPSTLLPLRVLTKLEGNYSQPSGIFRFATANPPRGWFRWWMIPLLVLVLAGYLKLRDYLTERGIFFAKDEAFG